MGCVAAISDARPTAEGEPTAATLPPHMLQSGSCSKQLHPHAHTTAMRLALQQLAAPTAAAAGGAPAPPAPPRLQLRQQRRQQQQHGRRQRTATVASAAATPAAPARAAESGHTALLHGLGEVGDVSPVHMPWLLRLAHIKSRITGGDSNVALQESARGLKMWKVGCVFMLLVYDKSVWERGASSGCSA